MGLSDRLSNGDIGKIEADVMSAEPGEWRVREGRLTRFGGAELSAASMDFAAKSRDTVPRLLRHVQALEDELARLRADLEHERIWRQKENKQYASALERARLNEAAPKEALDLIVSAIQVGSIAGSTCNEMLLRWARGEDPSEKLVGGVDASTMALEMTIMRGEEVFRTVVGRKPDYGMTSGYDTTGKLNSLVQSLTWLVERLWAERQAKNGASR